MSRRTEFAERRTRLINHFADARPAETSSQRVIEVASRFFRGDGFEESGRDVEHILSEPHGDMFWMLPMTLLSYVGRSVLPADVKQRIRRQWREYTPYRGDTENHWCMYYCSLYLMAQLYPGESGETWFNGRSSAENLSESREYLDYWFDLVRKRGLNEFDSPHYHPFYLAPVSLLYGFAEDDRIKSNAHAMLDLLVADFAADTLNGIYVGAHSRVYPGPMLERYRNGSNTFGWFLFGNTVFKPDPLNTVLDRIGYRPHGAAVYMAVSGYEPDDILTSIATERTDPYVHLERKRSRTRIRRHLPRSKDIYKTAFVCKDYAVGSIDGHLIQPVQQHSWEVQWTAEKPDEGFNVFFCLHPYWSEDEMATYFPEEPELLAARILEERKPTYTSEDKWTGGSPFQRIYQHRDAVLLLFDIPEGVNYQHIDAYFSRKINDLRETESGWIIFRGGNALIGFFPLCEYEWIEEADNDRRLRSHDLKNGAVIQVASVDDYDNIDLFENALSESVPSFRLTDVPQIQYESLCGTRIEFEYNKDPVVNGRPLNLADWPLFAGPFVNVDDAGDIILSASGEKRKLMFDLPNQHPLR